MGGNHFADGAPTCPNSDARETMCPSISAGTERQRTFEAHERQSFRTFYP